MAKSNSISKYAVWILLGLLIVGLAGFGADNLGGNIRSVGSVGDKQISTQAYFAALQREIRTVEQQIGRAMPFDQVQQIGLDQAVLQRLVTARALDHEASQLGLSVGDENVREQVLAIPAFQGLDGSFDREAYRFALENQGLSEGEFETTLREETARTLLQGAVVNGVMMPASFAETLVAYSGERRSFSWALLGAGNLDAQPPAATDSELRAFYDENTNLFTLPPSKRFTYAWVTPDMILDTVEVDEDALRAAYQERLSEFVQPERRLVERLVYLDEEAAKQAKAALEVGGSTFEALVDERGLSLSDVDLGDVGRLELDAAGEDVFAAEVGDVVGPLPSTLGPALFRVNGVLPARTVTFEDAMPDLREAVAAQRAARVIAGQAESYDDLMAGGATLEDLVAETDMVLGQIDWTAESTDGIAAYEDFREAASLQTADDFPEIIVLDDGGVFAMRLDEELPERPVPFDDARDDVSAAVASARTEAALAETAAAMGQQIVDGTGISALGLTVTEEVDRTRGAFIPGTPPEFLAQVFEMSPGDVRVISGGGIVTLVELASIDPVEQSDESRQITTALQDQLDQALARDLFQIFATDVQLRSEARIDQQALQAVHMSFP